MLAVECEFRNVKEELIRDRIVVGVLSDSLSENLQAKPKLITFLALLFKGCDLAATAGLRDTTAGLGNPGTLCTLPTFTQPSHELRLCVS